MILYRLGQWLGRNGIKLLGRLEVNGIERVPRHGPFLLVSNHQSILDPLLIQGVIRRPVYTMAKSTQFNGRIMGWLMPRICSFPARRYQIDPQCVRIALRRLGQGEPVGVYIEGERSWDARLQPPRLGTVRLILKAGVPVIPCTIQGSYDVWPRWDRRLRRANVQITFGEPLLFPRLDERCAREAAVPEAATRVMGALRGQLEAAGAMS